jgi:hypothetical protein
VSDYGDDDLEVVELEDGGAALVDADGDIAVLYDAAGNDLEIEPYSLRIDWGYEDDFYEPDAVEALEQRIDDFEQRQANAALEHQLRMAQLPGLGPLDTRAGQEQVMRALEIGGEDIERQLGRQLLVDEKRQLAASWIDAVQDGEDVTVEDVFVRAAHRGEIATAGLDLDRHEDRVDYMVGRMRGEEQIAASEAGQCNLLEPDSGQPFAYGMTDMDDDQERQSHMAARLQGRPDAGDDYGPGGI